MNTPLKLKEIGFDQDQHGIFMVTSEDGVHAATARFAPGVAEDGFRIHLKLFGSKELLTEIGSANMSADEDGTLYGARLNGVDVDESYFLAAWNQIVKHGTRSFLPMAQ